MMVENTTNRARAYALGGDDALEDVVFIATSRRARVVCVETYAPADEASPGRASTFSAATRRDAARVCPSRRDRDAVRGIAFERSPRARASHPHPRRAVETTRGATVPRDSDSDSDSVAAVVYETLRDLFGDGVRPNDDLASRGLDSIGAVEFATTLKRRLALDREIDTPTLATLPTPRAVIAFLERVAREDAADRDRREPPPRDVTATTRDARVKCLKSSASAPSLFLGAPAFGDGQLAYMKLARALDLGAHPAHTLERDVAEEPWPKVSIEHAEEIERRQGEGPIVLGGHSLGGVLAVETALALERAGRDVSTVLLFDAPHPVQFKSEWNDVPETNDDENESTGLTYMEVALTSFHFDTVAAGWKTMTREEKYAVFEDAAFQALGREFDARKLDREISGGPYAAQWNSGMRRADDGSIDTRSWWMLRGTEAAGEDDEVARANATPTFSRLRGRVAHYKAGREDSALFETSLRFDGGEETLESVGGYVWPLSCDHVEIVHCRGSHMNLMTPESEGGDLDETVVPHARRALADAWDDIAPTTTTTTTRDVRKDAWVSRAWHRPLGLWMRVSPTLDETLGENRAEDETRAEGFPSIVDHPDRFDDVVFGLNRLAWHVTAPSTPRVWILTDLLRDVSSWSHACFASAAPCLAAHLPAAALGARLDDADARAEIAARCVRAFRRAAGLDGDPARTFDVPVVVAVLGFDAALESVACETARQLSRRGERAVAVVIPRPDASSPRDDDPLRASRPALQALRTVLDDARRPSAAPTAADDDFAFVLARFHRLIADAELGKSRRRVIDDAKKFLRLHRPPTATARAWRAHADHAAALAETVVDAARDAFHPELVGARW